MLLLISCCPGLNFREVPKTNLGMEYKKIAGLVGSLICLGLFFLMLWFVIPRPTNIDVPVVVEDGDAVVNTIGTAYTLIDLHSVSALWSGSTMVMVIVIFLVTGCCCKNKALKTVHSHMSMKLKDEFTALLETYKRHDSSKNDKVQEIARVGVSAVLGLESAASRQEQLERRTQRERTRLDMEACLGTPLRSYLPSSRELRNKRTACKQLCPPLNPNWRACLFKYPD